MSSETPSKDQSRDGPDESAVVDYLKGDPEFLYRHPGLLVDLQVPHLERGSAESLIERQVGVLRDQAVGLKSQIQELVVVGHQNDGLNERLHRVALAMVSTDSLDNLLDTLPALVCDQFTLVSASLRIGADAKTRQREEFIVRDDKHYQALLSRIAHGSSVCDDRLPSNLIAYLFADQAEEIASSALVPLRSGDRVIGVMGVGADDVERYHPDMGTVFLDRLGQLIGAGLVRCGVEPGPNDARRRLDKR